MFNRDSNVTAATATMLSVKLESLNIELSLPDAQYENNEKKIEISVDDKVKWSYTWTSTFAPPLGQDLLIPLWSTVKVSLSGKHRVRLHQLGSRSGRIVDFLLLDPDKALILEDDPHGACATITMHLSPVVDYQKALSASLDASLARLDANPRLAEGLEDVDQAASAMETMNYAVETSGQYIVPLGQALRLMIKLIDNVAEAHPFLKVGWALLSSVYTAVQQQRLDDRDVQGLAESLRELVGVAGDCPVAEIKGTPDVIPSIARLALDVASLIDEYTEGRFIVRLLKAQFTDVRARIKRCQVDLQALHEKLRGRIVAYIAKRAGETQDRVKKMQGDAKRRDVEKLWDQIQEWLKPHDSSVNHKLARGACVKGTGAWFAEDERLLTWLKEPGRALWIPGAPGSGKTVLFSTAVEVVHGHETAAGCCAHFYFDARESGGVSQKIETLLRSILNQLCCKQEDIPDAIKRLYRVNDKEHPQPTLAQLKTTLGEVMNGFDDVYVMIDALDECDSQGALLDWMKSLQSTTKGLHLLVTSRPERIIEDRMSNFSHVRISLDSELLDDDIKTYVDERVDASDDLKSLMTEEMKKKLRAKGDGMFRLVAFWMDELKDCRNAKDITKKLQHLPTSLNAMYTSMILKITADDLQYARAIMPWVLFSVQPLGLEEIAAAACFTFSDGRPEFDENRRFGNPRAVLDVFRGLIVMSQDGVTLAHLTVKEFLLEQESPLHVTEAEAHSFIARSCLTYVLDRFQPRVDAGVERFPLHCYAATNWMNHASSTRDIEDTDSVIYGLALEVLHPKHETFRLWSSAWKIIVEHGRIDTYTTPLFVSARWGFQNLTATLLVLGVRDVTRSIFGCTALHVACKNGHAEIVKILLDSLNMMMNPAIVVSHEEINIDELAYVNMEDRASHTPLCRTCEGGHMDIVKLLLERGADVNPQGEDSDTPLRLACYGGHMDIVKLLLEKGADVHAQGEHSYTPLFSACLGGHMDIVKLLLEKGADVNPQGEDSDTPLRLVCYGGHTDVVKLLLEKGADVNAQDECSDTPLCLACEGGHTDIVKLLLEKGADVNPQGEDSDTPLSSACLGGHMDIVKLLLEKGADVNARREGSDTPLHFASRGGHLEVVRLLLEKGANPHLRNSDSDTPLDLARGEGHDTIVTALSVASSVLVN